MAATARFTPSRHQIGKIEAARRWLSAYLADGRARPASDVIDAGLAAGHKKRTLQLAAQQVCTIAPSRSNQGGITAWPWQLQAASIRLRLVKQGSRSLEPDVPFRQEAQ